MIGASTDRSHVAQILVEVLRGSLRNRRPETVAHDSGVGEAAAEALSMGIDAIAASEGATQLLLSFGLRAGFLGPSVETALRVAVIGVRRGWDTQRVVKASICGLLADIGMLKLPDEAIFKPCAMNAEEIRVSRLHPLLGSQLLEPLAGELAPQLATVALQHHERIDGSGYPNGLSGDAILEEAQAVGICHLYSAATHDHPYRETLSPGKAIALIEGLAGTAWDPRLVRAFAGGIALYPVGTLVRLASGESGSVVPGGTPLRPLVELRWAADGSGIPQRLVPASTTDTGMAIVAVGH